MHYFIIQNNSLHLGGFLGYIPGSLYVKYQEVKGSYLSPGPKQTDANILYILWGQSGKEPV